MDTSLNLAPPAAAAAQATPVVERAMTTKVQPVETADDAATLPADKPFVAQVVNARLSGADYPETEAEIAPPERTLRPYGVPMLPSDEGEGDVVASVEETATPAEPTEDPITA